MKARLTAIATAIFATAIAASASGECINPKAPKSAPNGSTATEAEMIVGMTAIKQYDTDANAYITCIRAEADARIAAAGDDAELVKNILSKRNLKHDAVMKDLQTRAAEFNEQLKAFKAKQKS